MVLIGLFSRDAWFNYTKNEISAKQGRVHECKYLTRIQNIMHNEWNRSEERVKSPAVFLISLAKR